MAASALITPECWMRRHQVAAVAGAVVAGAVTRGSNGPAPSSPARTAARTRPGGHSTSAAAGRSDAVALIAGSGSLPSAQLAERERMEVRMVDFSKLVGKQAAVDASDPLKLFDSLDRKGSHTTLRPAQIEALTALHQRRGERDHVLKLGTGVGKSTVALLYLRSYMATTKRPGVYLCPTRQLVLQVLEEADRLGIAAHEYPASEPHPEPACMAGKAVIVCTYAKLFNGKSTFDRTDVNVTPSAIVLDDAHAGIDEVRKGFTFHLTAAEVTKPLINIFEGAGRAYHIAIWEEILNGRKEPTLEIPYWSWVAMLDEVRACLSAHAEHKELLFVWPFLRDHLRWCRCVVAAEGIEIVPNVMPTQLVRAYDTAGHRLFMSGTLADEAVLVRELACTGSAALNPVVAGSDAGLGERMVLTPTLVDRSLNRKWVMKICADAAKGVRVVALCAKEERAKEWEAFGAKVVTGDAVIDVVEQLRSGDVKFAAFAQRYDGVDLPDEACRLLVIDGMPYGEGIVDRHDSSHTGARNRLVFRIEQGMGRAVRSPADYAVVVLAGPELASFTSKVDVRELMSADARVQLELAHELAVLAGGAGAEPDVNVVDMMRKCINRDPGWKAFYDERVRKNVTAPFRRAPDNAIQLADAEQRAAARARDGATQEAAQIMTDAMAKNCVNGDEIAKAYFIQQKASYLYATNRGEALEAQKHAYAKNRGLLRPPEGVVNRPADAGRIYAAAAVLRWYGTFANPNGAIAEFQAVRPKLSFAVSHNNFEQGLKELGVFIGAEGFRPEVEDGVGAPDNLLLWGDQGFVIEAKNEAKYDEIPKKDAEQLLHSMEWFKHEYPTREGVPIMAVSATKRGQGIFMPEDARILTPTLLERLLGAIESFLANLTTRSPSGWTEKEIAALLNQHALSTTQFITTFTAPVQ
jgi:hypothetical protein